jgi:predicted Zn-dependent peptidase
VALPQEARGAPAESALLRAAEAGFAALAPGVPHTVAAPAFHGGLRTKRDGGSSQAHLVLGWGLPALAGESPAATLAAAVLGEGMSSPLLDELREKRGLVYHASASADVLAVSGQFVVEASTAEDQLPQALGIVRELLERHAEAIPADELVRARNLLAVRRLRDDERPQLLLERAALDLFVHGRVRSGDEREQALEAVPADAVREVFAQGLAGGLAVALGGSLPRAVGDAARGVLGAWLRN